MNRTNYEQRCAAIHLLRSKSTPKQIAKELGRSLPWVYKCRDRYRKGGWEALRDQSRAPKRHPRELSEAVKGAIRRVRSELEAEVQQPGKLSYIGARAIQARLRKRKARPLPSISSIERELRRAGMVRPRRVAEPPEVVYPHLKPSRAHQLVQVDIFPHYLPGGPCVSCFNALDVVSRYPTGQQYLNKHSDEAAKFLLHVWSELGIPTYTQVDNESCFSGGFTHPYVLGKVLRLGLWVGTQLIFSPFRHPESNGFVERFHQDYDQNVWDKVKLPDLKAVQAYSPQFFEAYRNSEHHSALHGKSPASLHLAHPDRQLPNHLHLPACLPLTAGKVHFIRRVDSQHSLRLLNVDWEVSLAQPDQGVWATLEFTLLETRLRIFDAAPDAHRRRCLAVHPFPLTEPVLPLLACFRHQPRQLPWIQTKPDRSAQRISTML